MTERLPTESFDGRRELRVGDRDVQLIQLGPAHTSGDAIAYVPGASVVFTGDILFIEGTPIMWAGPVANWLNACDEIIKLDARVIVPGHGPVTDESGVRDVQRYLGYVRDEAGKRFEAGMDETAAADDIDIGDFRDWGDPERIAVNVATIYRELDPSLPPISPPSCSYGWPSGAPVTSRMRLITLEERHRALTRCGCSASTCQDHDRGKQRRQEVD